MNSFPIISHTDILFSIFENKKLMCTFSKSQLIHLRDCINNALADNIDEYTYCLIDGEAIEERSDEGSEQSERSP